MARPARPNRVAPRHKPQQVSALLLAARSLPSRDLRVHSLAVYYVTDPRTSATQRAKAQVKHDDAQPAHHAVHTLNPDCSL